MAALFPAIRRRIGVIGAFTYSGANFCLAALLQFHVGSAEFGLYAFALVLIQFGMGLSNALFAAPIVVWFEDRSVERQALVRSFALANLVFIGFGALVLATILLAIGMPGALVGLVSALAVALWLRWFCRAVELANHNFVWSAGADMAYGGVTLLAGGAFFYWFDIDVFWALVAMLAGTLASMAVIVKGTRAQVFARGRVSLFLFLRVLPVAWVLGDGRCHHDRDHDELSFLCADPLAGTCGLCSGRDAFAVLPADPDPDAGLDPVRTSCSGPKDPRRGDRPTG